LEKALHSYTLSSCEQPFDVKTVPAAPVEVERKRSQPEGNFFIFSRLETVLMANHHLGGFVTKKPEKATATRHDVFVEKLSAIPEIARCGPLFKSSQPVELTGIVQS
jgi:coatomer protein complex subunit gamma